MHIGKLEDWQKAWQTAQKEGVVGNTVPHENTETRKAFSVYSLKGSGKVYKVIWWRGSVDFISCSCPAGVHDRPCKHAAFILHWIFPEYFPEAPKKKVRIR